MPKKKAEKKFFVRHWSDGPFISSKPGITKVKEIDLWASEARKDKEAKEAKENALLDLESDALARAFMEMREAKRTKVLVNSSGSFELSDEGKDLYESKLMKLKRHPAFKEIKMSDRFFSRLSDPDGLGFRTDPILVMCKTELEKNFDGRHCAIHIEEIPTKYALWYRFIESCGSEELYFDHERFTEDCIPHAESMTGVLLNLDGDYRLSAEGNALYATLRRAHLATRADYDGVLERTDPDLILTFNELGPRMFKCLPEFAKVVSIPTRFLNYFSIFKHCYISSAEFIKIELDDYEADHPDHAVLFQTDADHPESDADSD